MSATNALPGLQDAQLACSLEALAATRLTGELEQARLLFAQLRAQADARGVQLRATPPEPTTCCGRGCNGCVWEGFYGAAEFWREDAIDACRQAESNPAQN